MRPIKKLSIAALSMLVTIIMANTPTSAQQGRTSLSSSATTSASPISAPTRSA